MKNKIENKSENVKHFLCIKGLIILTSIIKHIMIKRQLLILAITMIGIISCKNSNSEKQYKKAFNSPQDSILYHNYVNAIENASTFQYFTVIKINDDYSLFFNLDFFF